MKYVHIFNFNTTRVYHKEWIILFTIPHSIVNNKTFITSCIIMPVIFGLKLNGLGLNLVV